MKLFRLLDIMMGVMLFMVGSRAQTPPVRFERLSTNDGLLSNNIRAILQDRQGYMWFGSYGGISRYDGYSFKHYRYDAQDTTSLGGSHVIGLWEDPKGYMWAAVSNGGLARLDPRTDQVKRYTANRRQRGRLHTNDVTAVLGDRYGAIWVGTIEGLSRFDPRSETFTRYPKDKGDVVAYRGAAMVSDITEDSNGTIWVATLDQGFSRINQKLASDGKSLDISFTHFRHDPDDPKSILNNQVSEIFEDHTGTMWLGTFNGLYQFDKRTGRCTLTYRHNPADKLSISSSWILRQSIAEDRQGNLWIGTYNGLNRLNPQRTRFDRFYHDPFHPKSIHANIIQRVMVDRTGIVWVGTNDAGISKFDPNLRSLSFIGYGANQPNPLAGYNIRSICQDNMGRFWVGTEGGGMMSFDPATSQVKLIQQTSRKDGLPTNFIGPMLKDRSGTIWIGMGSDWTSGTRGQIVRFNPKTNRFTTYMPFPAPHRYAFVLTIFEDERGLIWFATGNMGLISFDPKQNQWRQYTHNPADPATLRGKWSLTGLSDRRGNIWVGTDAGLDRLEYATGRITHFINNPKDPHTLSSNYIMSLCMDRAGQLWVGTDGGLCRYDSVRNGFIRYTDKDGLIDNSIANMLDDDDGYIWLNTPKGLCRLAPETATFTVFDVGDNDFVSGNIQLGACHKADDGTLYFGGKNGIIRFHPHKLRFNRLKPPVVLTAVRLFDKLLPGSYDRQTITLAHDQNSLTVEFAALNYTSSEKNQYAYQLEHFDPAWIYAGTRRNVTYTNLNPGTYTFRVKGSNSDGLWNEKGTFMTIVIQPAWWQTLWFRTLLLLTVFGLTYAAYRYRMDQLQHEQSIRDQISRDLHDDVGGILSGISFYSEAAQQMHQQGRHADAYQLLLKIADNARQTITQMSDVVWSMRSDTNNAGQLAQRLESVGRELLTAKGIGLIMEADPALDRLSLRPDVVRNLYLIGKEALHNAAKYSQATQVVIRVVQVAGRVQVSVTDNGSGFDPQLAGRGNGLDNMPRRAEAVGATYWLNSDSGQGTSVSVEKAL